MTPHHRWMLICLCGLVSAFPVSITAVAQSPARAAGTVADDLRPDMVIFLSDDHTVRDSSVYAALEDESSADGASGNGASGIATPNMQRLADAGMTFDRAFVASPSCAPSRAAMLTGLYPANNGAEPNHSRPRADLKKLPAYLQQLGYEVVSFGKVGHYRQTPEYGFDLARHYNYHEDVAVPKAIEWLESRNSDQPLCLFVGTNWPHVPWPEDISGIELDQLKMPVKHVDTPATRQWRARYIQAVRTMDRELGAVYDAARRKLGDDVFFLHTSDHGAQWPFAKWNLYEDGIRTPLIVSWPGRIPPNVRTQAMVSWIDLLPTLVDVADGKPPSDLDGESFLPVLKGESTSHREQIFTAHSGDGNFNVYPIRSVRTADGWKYIRNLHPEFRFTSHVTKARADSGYWTDWLNAGITDPRARQLVRDYHRRPAEELYYLPEDPREQHNLVDDPTRASVLMRLREQVDQWMVETDDAGQVYGTPRRVPGPDQPNVITVFIDDMGWSDLSSFGGTGTQTENIDRLANEGLRFHHFYVNSPICSPSRVALTTGQYPHRWRITSYLANRQQNRQRGIDQWLDPDAPVLARQLNLAGYATGHFGKWHMGGQRDVGNAPRIRAYGFDRSLTNFEGLGPRVLPLKDAYDGKPPGRHDLGSAQLGNGPIRWHDRSQITAEFVDEAVTFINHAEVTDQPFYINLWPDDVHSPFFPPKELREATDGSKRQRYLAVLDAMDEQLGVLFDRVRGDPKLRENTLILVMSDNGHEEGAGRSDPLRAGKTWLYEGGIRSPLIVWGPGLMAEDVAGTINDTSVLCALDINRTLYSVAGVTPPEDVTLDGEDLRATLLGFEQASRKAPIFWRRPPDRPGNDRQDNPDLAVRDGQWKYLVNYDDSDPQLYDLIEDPGETENLVDQHPEPAKRLNRLVMEWNASMPQDAGNPNANANETD